MSQLQALEKNKMHDSLLNLSKLFSVTSPTPTLARRLSNGWSFYRSWFLSKLS